MTMKSNFQSRESPPCISSWASGIDHVVTCHKKWIQLISSVMIYGISREYTNWDIKMNILFGLSPYNVFLNGPLVMPQWFNYNQIKLCMLISHMPKRVVAHNHNWICLGHFHAAPLHLRPNEDKTGTTNRMRSVSEL